MEKMNKVILMGRLTKDPEMRYTSSNNIPVCSFTLAVPRQFCKSGEDRQSDFIQITTFSKTAEFCQRYFTKGKQVAVVGRIQTRTWDDADGKKHYATDVIADEVHFTDSKGDKPTEKPEEKPEPGFYATVTGEELPF